MHWWYAIYISGWVISLIMVPVLAHRYSPAKALGWLAVMFAVPWVGPVLFVMFAANPLGRRRIVRYRQALDGTAVADRFEQIERHVQRAQLTPQLGAIARAAEACGALPPNGGNALEFSIQHEQTLEWLLRDIDAAQKHVHLVFYIIGDDDVGRRVVEALERAAARGVCSLRQLDLKPSSAMRAQVRLYVPDRHPDSWKPISRASGWQTRPGPPGHGVWAEHMKRSSPLVVFTGVKCICSLPNGPGCVRETARAPENASPTRPPRATDSSRRPLPRRYGRRREPKARREPTNFDASRSLSARCRIAPSPLSSQPMTWIPRTFFAARWLVG